LNKKFEDYVRQKYYFVYFILWRSFNETQLFLNLML
jgi:hypothetical protein